MKAYLPLFLATLLTGCASPQSLIKSEPVISATTDKAPTVYTQCVGPLWQDFNPAVSVTPTSSGYRLTTMHSMAGTDDVLVINEMESGSAITLYQRVQMMRQPLRDAVNQCL